MLLAEEDAHQLHAEFPYQAEGDDAPDGGGDDAQNSALQPAEGIPCRNFKRLTGDDGNDDLKNNHCAEDNAAAPSFFLHPIAQCFRVGEERCQGCAKRLPENYNEKQHRRNDRNGNPLFL